MVYSLLQLHFHKILIDVVLGDVVSLKVPGQRLVILNSAQAAEDLLEKRSAIYSGRPELTVIHM
jgi:hypothetical protein